MRGTVALVTFALIFADHAHIVAALFIRARIEALVGHECQSATVGRERHATIELVGDHATIRFRLARQWHGRSAIHRQQPQVGSDIGVQRHGRHRRGAIGKRARRVEHNPPAIWRELRTETVGLASLGRSR